MTADEKHDRTLRIPPSASEITPDWLTHALREKQILKSGGVKSVEMLPVESGHGLVSASARLRLQYDSDDTGLPEIVFVKFASDVLKHPRWFAVGAREATFYAEIATRSKIRVPTCYYCAVDAQRKRYVIVLEDLSWARCGDWRTGCSLREAELAVSRIAHFHAQWWEHPTLHDSNWLRFADFGIAQQVYVERLGAFLDRNKGNLPREITDASVRLANRLVEIMDQLHYVNPMTIVHHDYQLDNLFFGPSQNEEDLIIIDWQMVNLGRGVLDVANFLGGNIDPEVRRANEERVLRGYHGILIDDGVEDYPFDQCLRDYRLSMVQRLVRAVVMGGESKAAQDKLEDVIFPRYFQAFMDLRTWELI